MSKQAMQKALDALEDRMGNLAKADAAIAELRVAIDAPEPKHVDGKWCADLHCNKCYSADFRFKHAPPDTEGLRRDAERYRWLTDDHPDRETREAVIRIGGSIWCRGKGSTDSSIDAAIAAQGGKV